MQYGLTAKCGRFGEVLFFGVSQMVLPGKIYSVSMVDILSKLRESRLEKKIAVSGFEVEKIPT
ncbi:MAG: hypothetical protein CME16_04870 [Gemmatimonadetes bacterium]|nr:hypothetical protein [Gemmatimonadota bacterium]